LVRVSHSLSLILYRKDALSKLSLANQTGSIFYFCLKKYSLRRQSLRVNRHRPYLALYEQTLTSIIKDIANQFTTADKQKYVDASLRFRVPYWDWASDTYLPDIVSKKEKVSVTNPNGTVQTINNPLYSYTFHPLSSDFGDGLPDEKMVRVSSLLALRNDRLRQWESWQSTVRWPTRNDSAARSQPEVMERQLSNNRLTIRDRTYNLLTQATDYAAFSNDGFLGPGSNPKFYDSLESIHGQVCYFF
jgi:tyrosinase